jgi:hypothetical protein
MGTWNSLLALAPPRRPRNQTPGELPQIPRNERGDFYWVMSQTSVYDAEQDAAADTDDD